MRKKTVLIAMLLALFIPTLLQMFIWGDFGLLSKRQMEQELASLKNELNKFEIENANLETKLHRLTNNPEMIRQEAHKMLMLEPDAFMLKFID